MNKKLGHLIHPGMGIYFAVMAFFSLCALVMEYTVLALAEIIVTVVLFVFYTLRRYRRHHQLQQYLQTIPGAIESVSQGECPFPMVMIRLGDGGIVWANEQFIELTGFSDTMLVGNVGYVCTLPPRCCPL